MLIAEMNLEERPREKLAKHGAATLSDAELVAILLGSGTRGRSAIAVAHELLANGLVEMARRDWGARNGISGVGPAKASRLSAALELGRRVSISHDPRNPVRDTATLGRQLIARYSHYMQERFGAIYLDTRKRLIRERELFVGTLNATTVSSRDVYRWAILEGAAHVIVFHNHPSGDPSPSAEDLVFTKRLKDAGGLLGVNLLDHLIIGSNRFISMKERGLIG